MGHFFNQRFAEKLAMFLQAQHNKYGVSDYAKKCVLQVAKRGMMLLRDEYEEKSNLSDLNNLLIPINKLFWIC